ncbi:class II aldolase/adducin family protein [Myxococcota bacterium]|nr:class II aldolase/adducin family protein [Myxococcota bacterium]
MIDLKQGAELVRYAHAMHRAGWVANHDGNLSVRVGEDRYLASPTARSKADLTLDSLIVVDGEGTVLVGRSRPFGEWPLHRRCYRERPDVSAVVHAHPPHAAAFACAGLELPGVFIPEAVVSLGARVPTTRFAVPQGEPGADPLDEVLGAHDAFLLASHGALAVGTCLEQAYCRLELVEHLARIAAAAVPLGGVRPLPPEAVADLLERRRRAGLGPESRPAPSAPLRPADPPTSPSGGGPDRWSLAPAPSAWSGGPGVRSEATCGAVYGAAPGNAPEAAGHGGSPGAADRDLSDLVRREIARVLGRG